MTEGMSLQPNRKSLDKQWNIKPVKVVTKCHFIQQNWHNYNICTLYHYCFVGKIFAFRSYSKYQIYIYMWLVLYTHVSCFSRG